MRDPYSVLGVSRKATPADIKRAYRHLVRENHPDSEPGNAALEERFKEIGAAYALLSDVVKRAAYDRGEIDSLGAPRARPRPSAGDRFNGAAHGPKYRSRARGFSARKGTSDDSRSVRVRGADVSYGLTVDFLEAARGTRKRVSMANGNRLDVLVPAGAVDGQVLRLGGQGMPGLGGGANGDALVEIQVRRHPFLRREGHDVLSELPVSVPEAVLGGAVRIVTIDGPVTLKVPAGSNTGTVLRLRGKGMPSATGGRGDHLVSLRVVLPAPTDTAFTEFVRTWAPDSSYDPRAQASEQTDG